MTDPKSNGKPADYQAFLAHKTNLPPGAGFDPIEIPSFLFPFQRHLVDWAIRQGRAAIFADCGLGKTPMQLVWATNVIRHTDRPVLILTPLSVSAQTVREAEKFGIPAEQSRTGEWKMPIVVTNYEKLHYFKPDDFAGVVCDESSILKNFDGKTKAAVTEFMRTIPYRLLCTATAAPNDYDELGTSAEALGELGYTDMLTRFFREDIVKDHLGWGRKKYRLRAHGEHDFWRWVCSWARACRKPSDLGFDDDRFTLPSLTINEHVVVARNQRPGFLFDMPAMTLPEQAEERRRTIPERCERIAELVKHDRSAIVWCHLIPEGKLLKKLIPDSVEVSGSTSDDAKERAFDAFVTGQIRVMITKPKIGGFGLNWQHCAHQTFFPSHSYEQFYQCVRRSYRFYQERDVVIDIVGSEGERVVKSNLERKSIAADVMFSKLVELMNAELKIERTNPHQTQEEMPSWLSQAS